MVLCVLRGAGCTRRVRAGRRIVEDGMIAHEVLEETDAATGVSGAEATASAGSGGALSRVRHPNSWAAYGRYLHAAIRTRSVQYMTFRGDDLCYFRRRIRGLDAGMVYAFQECETPETPAWTTAVKALETLRGRGRVDQLFVYVAGAVTDEDSESGKLHTVLGGDYLGLAFPIDTRDILELRGSFEEFLRGLGHSNRRHMKAHYKEAIESGFSFELSSDREAAGTEQRYGLAMSSRPVPYPREQVDTLDELSQAQPGFFHVGMFSPAREMMSYCSGFVEQDTAIVMYQFNHAEHPRLALSMTLRAYLIERWAGTEIKRILLPVGINGHLTHATTSNPIVQVFFVRRSVTGVAKAMLGAAIAPGSDAGTMVRTDGFLRRVVGG